MNFFTTFFQKQIYYQFLTKSVPGCLAWKKSKTPADGKTRTFQQTLHQPAPFSCTFQHCIFLGNTVSCLLELILNTCQIKNMGTTSNALFLFSLSYRQPEVNVNTEKTLQRSPHNWQNTFVLLSTAASTKVQ